MQTKDQLIAELRQHLPMQMPRIKDVCALFDCDRTTLWRWRQSGAMPTRTTPTGRTWIAHEDIADAILAGNLPVPFDAPADEPANAEGGAA